MRYSFLETVTLAALAGLSTAQELSSTIVGCADVHCPNPEDSTDNVCTLVDRTFGDIGLARIPTDIEELSWVRGNNITDDEGERRITSSFYLGTPFELDTGDTRACAAFFHQSTARFPEDRADTAQGTCEQANIDSACIDALVARARTLRIDDGEDACERLQEDFLDNLDRECRGLAGTDRWESVRVRPIFGPGAPDVILSSDNLTSNCWPIEPKQHDLAFIESHEVTTRNLTAARTDDMFYDVTPILTVFYGAENGLVANFSSQITCLKVVNSSVALEAIIEEQREEEEGAAAAIHVSGAMAAITGVVTLFSVLLLAGTYLVRRSRRDRTSYVAVPGSPVLKQQRQNALGSWLATARSAAWWLGDEVTFLGRNWGRRGELVFGSLWAVWLLFLCVIGTGNDYLHLTKRFAIVAVSQLPIQYVLALKKFNPVALIFRSSHEGVNRWHRVLGRVIYYLMCLHAAFYLNYYYQMGILGQRIIDIVPALGLTAFIGMVVLNTTALSIIRRYSYRIFFITHLIVALALPPVVFFHHRSSTFYVVEALALFTIDLVLRKMDTFTTDASLVSIPGSNLIKIVAPVPPQKISRFRESPGTHVYLSVPASSRPSPSAVSAARYIFEFMFNPFTIASVDEHSTDLTLIARCLNGPMTQNLTRLANGSTEGIKTPLSIEGPYGSAARFPNFAGPEFDQILLVAGGVGASFVLPVYRSVLGENPGAAVTMVWAVRSASDATWPASDVSQSILKDDKVQLYLTGDILESRSGTGSLSAGDTELEMDHLSQTQPKYSPDHSRRRPDLQKIVDDVFKHGVEERVAVLVCGPEGMADELRRCVGTWVRKGRKVWWHNESFGW
ncbi:hypothetical protein DL764_003836 [Monosporascus ibericus]|uniref:FAD-binding FR-type domain-containing protein n=1 Tax=Monosporascus ibericus TaxID=155417 RepID=A0A4Q4TF25_9PEZI|nr:hypothetical protein DL764_003836 [Monosporascus ibericus]